MKHIRTSLKLRWLMLALMASVMPWVAQAGVVVIAHPTVRKLDLQTVQRIYTGKVVEVDGVAVIPVQAPSGQSDRSRFLHDYLGQTDDQFIAYWTVRRYVGKGVPPREIGSPHDVIAFVIRTPGAVGYIDESDVTPSLNVVLRH